MKCYFYNNNRCGQHLSLLDRLVGQLECYGVSDVDVHLTAEISMVLSSMYFRTKQATQAVTLYRASNHSIKAHRIDNSPRHLFILLFKLQSELLGVIQSTSNADQVAWNGYFIDSITTITEIIASYKAPVSVRVL
jgi:hypothetical protein